MTLISKNSHTKKIQSGVCPLCKTKFNAKEAEFAFPVTFENKRIYLVFGLCPSCIIRLTPLDTEEQKRFANIAISNFFKVRNPKTTKLTITSSLAMAAHNDNFYDAWSIGVDIPRDLFDLLNDGHIDTLSFFPGGCNCIPESRNDPDIFKDP